MENIVYVTGNIGKYNSMKKLFDEYKIELDYYNIDLKELDVNDISLISKDKVIQAYEILKRPCFVADSGFYIEDYPNNPGYPGAFVKRSGIADNVDKLLLTMENVPNRKCKFLDCLTYYDGNNFYQFYGESEGILSTKKRGVENKYAKSNLWYVFIPKNCNKTLAEMSDEERKSRKDFHKSASKQFIEWYINNKQKIMKL